ncbi:hypothetical protein TNCV_526341 [Trichonephila clavipes]|nr:hypothetical protein TNCV_526341 [Trichonephila clavipes]
MVQDYEVLRQNPRVAPQFDVNQGAAVAQWLPWQICHEFEPSTTKDPPCRAAMHVKSVESRNVLPSVCRVVSVNLSPDQGRSYHRISDTGPPSYRDPSMRNYNLTNRAFISKVGPRRNYDTRTHLELAIPMVLMLLKAVAKWGKRTLVLSMLEIFTLAWWGSLKNEVSVHGHLHMSMWFKITKSVAVNPHVTVSKPSCTQSIQVGLIWEISRGKRKAQVRSSFLDRGSTLRDPSTAAQRRILSLTPPFKSGFELQVVLGIIQASGPPLLRDAGLCKSHPSRCRSQERTLYITLPRPTHSRSFGLLQWATCQVIYSRFGLAIHQNDHQTKRRFVEWAQNEIAVVLDFHKRILFSDEAHFFLNGYVNKQNCHISSEANPQVFVETPLHPEKLTVWCALWAGGILLQKR